MIRLGWFTKNAKAGDYLVFHYSGHGSQIRDRDGDELNDNMDELICPYDIGWDDTFITDDDLNKALPVGQERSTYTIFYGPTAGATRRRQTQTSAAHTTGLSPIIFAST